MMNLNQDQNDTLDRLWAATRPEEPSADAFDRLWAEIRDRASRPEILPFTSVPTWKRWGLALAVTAQAAALLIAAFVALKRPEPMQIVQNTHTAPPPFVYDYQLAVGMTMFVNLEGSGVVKEVKVRPQMPESDIDVVTAESDVLNFMESYE